MSPFGVVPMVGTAKVVVHMGAVDTKGDPDDDADAAAAVDGRYLRHFLVKKPRQSFLFVAVVGIVFSFLAPAPAPALDLIPLIRRPGRN